MSARLRTHIPDFGGARQGCGVLPAIPAWSRHLLLAVIALPCCLAGCGDSSDTTTAPEVQAPPGTLAESIEPTAPQAVDFADDAINEVEEENDATSPGTPAEN